MRTPTLLLVLLAAAFTCSKLPAQTTATTPAALEFFEQSVRPVLASKCYSCHGASTQSAGLRLDSRASLLKGGDMGAELVPGDVAKSRLIVAIRQTGNLKMPPSGRCSDTEIEAISNWVKMGAPWPSDTKPVVSTEDKMRALRKSLWSLQPVTSPVAPAIRQAYRAANPIDRFILAELDKKGLKPAKVASRATLIRRATFDLIGLPPTPEEEHAFVADRAPDAYPRLLDRLLASPHYGERWARQWLDLARYSDTLGYLVGTNGRRFPYAYTYRDYVIRALNADKPYDQFVLEQLAADQLNLKDKQDLAALGFITVGNRYLGDQQEIMDDRIDVVGRGLQGLTLGCARCHTHKFDPVPIEDYYSLYAIFSNGHEPDIAPQIGEASNRQAAAAYDIKLKQFETRIAEAKKKKDDGGADNIGRDMLDFKATDPGAPPCAMAYYDNDKPAVQHVFLRGSASNQGPVAPARFLFAVLGDDRKPFTKGSGRLELARAIAAKDNPLTARVMVNRIWLGHFGRGLVRTPSDFGVRGELPTHPDLLDWLAGEFMAGKNGAPGGAWSIKKMHRLIMLSNSYKQSSDGDPGTMKVDPDNRLVGRMNRRRLDFEEMRDAMLSVSGLLDANLYGQPVEGLEKSRRRTLYTFLDRQSMPGLMRAFDFPDANQHAAQRSNTTVPQQSLFLLNSPFVQAVARALATRGTVMDAPDDRSRAARLVSLTTSRPPDAAEIQMASHFIARMEKTPPTVQQPATSDWRYGYGEFDAMAGRLKSCTPMARFTGTTWQGGDKLPDPVTGWASLHAVGGHPGDHQHDVIRRWTAPWDMTISITGTLNHPSPNGDGVLGVVLLNSGKVLASKSVAHTSLPMVVDTVALHRGDTIDFIIDCQANFTSDSFEWSPIITTMAPATGIQTASNTVAGKPAKQGQWTGAGDFSGPITPVKPLSAWDIYAQALMLTNDFLYID